ncbi:MAG TPA: hypothetical protein VGW38_20180, partial [Chloroflexota bacterium]|nr:hypothetical protein [Chloroflexota bacterium]
AAGTAGAVLLVLFFANSLSRTNTSLEPFRWLSPFWYYDRSDALVPGGSLDPLGIIVSPIATLALSALAAVAFMRRDLGESLLCPRWRARAAVRVPSRNPLLRVPVLPSLYEQRAGLLFWLIGVSLLASMFSSLARSMVDLMENTPTMRAYLALLARGGTNLSQSFIGLALFGVLQLLLAIYAVTHVARWAADDAEGRLELTLAQPVHRWWVVVERGLVLLVGATAIATMGALVAGLSADSMTIQLDTAALSIAALLLIPLTLAFGAVGAALIGLAPRAAVPFLATVALVSYFVQQFGRLFRWPEWIMGLSLFELYGTPLTAGVYWTGLWLLLGITAAGFAVGIVSMRWREIGT